ncbi:MAG: hypothetical protein JWP37_3785 [Mucilaginibacter sp.]|nr:hypothetical protein [Mucilaginibacter sp.]
MANPIEYIVYEPDQVLTNDHLNETFNYLDQQNRWTRNKLIGIGIVCGLDIVPNPTNIQVNKGCGVTSQGYLIAQDTTPYKWYMPYTPIDVPTDLPFQYTNGDLPFYKPFCNGKTIWLLLTDDQHGALDSTQQNVNAISSATAGFLNDYVVVLFLEAKEMDLKNCDMLDCNNKGEKMSFVVRPLLVLKKDLPVTQNNGTASTSANGVKQNLPHQILFKRYNVPYTDLNNTDDVLNAFVKLVDDTTLTQVSNAYNYCYTQYNGILKISTNPFTNLLTNLKSYRDQLLTNNPIYIEYFYDFIDDLIKAYYEFSIKVSDLLSSCCPDENLFPLHLVLGAASQATSSFVIDAYRNYFIYSPLFSKVGNESAEAVLLFNRMVIMVQQFTIQVADQLQGAAFRQRINIKITPSQYEFPWLSERAIPYYYNVNVSGSELYKSWSYYKTSHGSAAFNLGFNAYQYNSNTAVIQPLLYDIEHYNFFRVEGHIGLDYQTVLSNILNQRLNYNLPFDVMAISADLLSSDVALPQCNFLDLETDYKLLLSEAACKIHTTFCFITQLPFLSDVVAILGTSLGGTPAATDTTNAVKFSAFKLNILNIDEIELPDTTKYQKGDYLRNYCPPTVGKATIGSVYLDVINKGSFINPISNPSASTLALFYHTYFLYIDAVEELMNILYTNTLDQLDMAAFRVKYLYYLRIAGYTILILADMDAGIKTGTNDSSAPTFLQDLEFDLLLDEMDLITTLCVDELLQVLKNEYTRRLNQYQQQHTFINYYKNHPGLEHKAGVPKGGTLVLVYHTDTQPTFNTGLVFGRFPVSTNLSASIGKVQASSVTYDDNTIQLIRSFVDDCKDAPVDKKQALIEILSNRPPQQPKYQVADGMVIADFYIPYLCCSDCPPMAYIVPAQDTPVITMDSVFCITDANAEPITVSIPGGTFNTLTGLDGTNFKFTPSLAGLGQHTITYTLSDGKSDSKTVNVIAPPDNSFGLASGKLLDFQTFEALFTPTVQDSSLKYQWTADTALKIIKLSVSDTGAADLRSEFGQGLTQFTMSLTVSNVLANEVNCQQQMLTKTFFITPNDIQDSNPDGGTILSTIGKIFKGKSK